jgi:stearoyl-CoA desaturase (Delta-9 desaturase)
VILLLEKLGLAEVLTRADEGWENHRRRIPQTVVNPATGIGVAAKNSAKG